MKFNAVRTFVQRSNYLIWPEDPQDLEWFYEQLVSQILKNTKVKKFAEDRPGTAQPEIQPQNKENIELENIRAVPTWTLDCKVAVKKNLCQKRLPIDINSQPAEVSPASAQAPLQDEEEVIHLSVWFDA